MPQTTHDRILGAFYGQALGDAFGMPSELWSRTRVIEHFGWIDHFLDGPQENSAAQYFVAGQITDDTSMAIAVADSIIECKGKIDPASIGRHILSWAENFDAFSKNILGPTSKVALTALRNSIPIQDIANLGMTNGAAMRAVTLGCLMPPRPIDQFVLETRAASSATHKSDISVAAAVAKAGLKIGLYDLENESLAPNIDSLKKSKIFLVKETMSVSDTFKDNSPV